MAIDYKQEAEYLRDQIDRMRDEERRASEAAYERREQERKQRRQEMLEAECVADDWDEAFMKAIPRLRHEARSDAEDAGYEPGDENNYFFTRQTAQHVAAYELWKLEKKANKERVIRIRERAERLIASIEQQSRERIAEQIEQVFPKSWELVENLRDDDYMALVNW